MDCPDCGDTMYLYSEGTQQGHWCESCQKVIWATLKSIVAPSQARVTTPVTLPHRHLLTVEDSRMGGKACLKTMTPDERRTRARLAAKALWKKKKG